MSSGTGAAAPVGEAVEVPRPRMEILRRFLTATNLTNLVLQITAVGLISVGVVLVLLLGEIDLSVGAVSGLAAAVMAVLNVKHGWNPYLAIAVGVLCGMAIGVL